MAPDYNSPDGLPEGYSEPVHFSCPMFAIDGESIDFEEVGINHYSYERDDELLYVDIMVNNPEEVAVEINSNTVDLPIKSAVFYGDTVQYKVEQWIKRHYGEAVRTAEQLSKYQGLK